MADVLKVGGHSVGFLLSLPLKGLVLGGLLVLFYRLRVQSMFVVLFVFVLVFASYLLFGVQDGIVWVQSQIHRHVSGITSHPQAYKGLVSWILPGLSLMYILKCRRLYDISRSHWLLALFFFTLTMAIPFGSDSFWSLWSLTGFFGLLSSLVLLQDVIPSSKYLGFLLFPFILVSQIITLFVYFVLVSEHVADGLPVTMAHSHSPILMTKADANFINELTTLINRSGFSANTPMIEMTGFSLQIIPYFVDAKIIGFPYNNGERPFADAFLRKTFEHSSCEQLARSWILTSSPSCPYHLSLSAIHDFGGNLLTDYQVMGTVPVKSRPDCFIMVSKPTRTLNEAMLACTQLRKISH